MTRALEGVKFDSTFTGRNKLCILKGKVKDKVQAVPLKHVIHNIKTNNDLA